MRKTDYIPIAVVTALAGFIGFQIAKAPARPSQAPVETVTLAETSAAPQSRTAQAKSVSAGRPASDVDGLLRISAFAAPERDIADIRRRLMVFGSNTYIAETLKQLDSAVYRWHDRSADPIRIWIAPASGPGADALVRLVRESFADWTNTGIPVRFTFVVDKADADVSVVWIDKFDSGNRTGHTRVVYDQDRWLNPGGEITLATRRPQGDVVAPEQVRSVAVHEVGHLLGLSHSPDSTDIMFPTVYVNALSRADVATIRLVYSVPAGSIK